MFISQLDAMATCPMTMQLVTKKRQLWQSQVEIKHYSAAYLSCSKHCSTELLLRTGLIRTALMHEYLISLRSAYERRPYGSSALQCFECGKAVEKVTE